MNGKDYCNCDHAQMLRGALREARDCLVGSVGETDPDLVESAYNAISWALVQDRKMRVDYERSEATL